MPLAAPGVFTTAILTFFFCWNDFLFAISLTSTNNARTVPFFSGRWRDQSKSDSTSPMPNGSAAPHPLRWRSFKARRCSNPSLPYVMAASVVVTIPVVILVLAFRHGSSRA